MNDIDYWNYSLNSAALYQTALLDVNYKWLGSAIKFKNKNSQYLITAKHLVGLINDQTIMANASFDSIFTNLSTNLSINPVDPLDIIKHPTADIALIKIKKNLDSIDEENLMSASEFDNAVKMHKNHDLSCFMMGYPRELFELHILKKEFLLKMYRISMTIASDEPYLEKIDYDLDRYTGTIILFDKTNILNASPIDSVAGCSGCGIWCFGKALDKKGIWGPNNSDLLKLIAVQSGERKKEKRYITFSAEHIKEMI